jgi:hypothetical protein
MNLTHLRNLTNDELSSYADSCLSLSDLEQELVNRFAILDENVHEELQTANQELSSYQDKLEESENELLYSEKELEELQTKYDELKASFESGKTNE